MAKSAVKSIEDLTIVDCDVHVTEDEEDLLPYLEDPYDSMLNNEAKSNVTPGAGLHYPSAGLFTPMDTGKIQDDVLETPEDVTELKKMMSLDRTLVTPGLNLLLSCVHDIDLATALGNAFNSWLLDTIVDEDKGIFGTIVVNPHQPDKAAEEIDDRSDESGLVGVMVPPGGISGRGPLLGDPFYHQIYDAAEDANMPVVMHNSVSAGAYSFSDHFRGSSKMLTAHVAHHPSDYLWHLGSILTHGVPERYPDLDFVVQETGIGWIPYFIKRFDDEFSEKRQDAPILRKPPSEYFLDQFYVTSQPIEGQDDPEYVAQMIRLFEGEHNLMFASDYPHPDFDHSERVYNLLRTNFEDNELANIFGETAMDVFDFPA